MFMEIDVLFGTKIAAAVYKQQYTYKWGFLQTRQWIRCHWDNRPNVGLSLAAPTCPHPPPPPHPAAPGKANDATTRCAVTVHNIPFTVWVPNGSQVHPHLPTSPLPLSLSPTPHSIPERVPTPSLRPLSCFHHHFLKTTRVFPTRQLFHFCLSSPILILPPLPSLVYPLPSLLQKDLSAKLQRVRLQAAEELETVANTLLTEGRAPRPTGSNRTGRGAGSHLG